MTPLHKCRDASVGAGFSRSRAPQAPLSPAKCRFAARDRLKPAPTRSRAIRYAKISLSEGESRAAKREPDRAKHQQKARQGVCSITQTTLMQSDKRLMPSLP